MKPLSLLASRAALLLALGVAGVACADGASLAQGQSGPQVQPTPPTPPTGPGTTSTPPTPPTGAQPGAQPGTKGGGGEPARNNDVYAAVIDRSGNARDVRKVFAKGESPEGIRLARDVGPLQKGNILLYFMDFTNWASQGQDATAVVTGSTDGVVWSTPRPVRLDDAPLERKSFVDVSVVQLDDGRLRMYFMARKEAYETTVPIRSALSTDGVNFAVEPGVRIASTDNVEVARAGATWVMFMSDYPKGTSGVATSTDGLAWLAADRVVPGVGIGAYEANGGLAYLTHGGSGLLGYGFDARGRTASKDHSYAVEAGGGLADASPVVMSDGSLLVFFKRMGGGMKPAPRASGAPPQRSSPQQHKERPPSAR